jgi:hypothetical protein
MGKISGLFCLLALLVGVGNLKPVFADTTAAATSAPTLAATPVLPTLVFGGMFDGYYVYNFPNSTDGTVGQGNNSSVYFYNGKDDSFSLGLAELTAVATQGQGSFHLVLADGISASPNAGGVGLNPGNSLGIDVLQAYLSYNPGLWTINAGRFVSWMGQEVIESQNNWNYTHSLLFQYTRPYWTTGLSAMYKPDSTFHVTGYAVDGWNNAAGSGIGKTYGFQVGLTPDSVWKFTLNGIVGPGSGTSYVDFSNSNAANFVGEAIIVMKATDKLSFALDADYVAQDIPGASTNDVFGSGADAWGIAFYGRYQIQNDWAVALRLESLEDNQDMFGLYGNNFMLPGNSLAVPPAKDVEAQEMTLTIEHNFTPNILFRLEGRFDAALSGGQEVPLTKGPFIPGSVDDQADEITGTGSAVYSF